MFRNPLFLVSTRISSGDGGWSINSCRCGDLGLLGLGEERKESEVGTTPDNTKDDKVSCPPGGEGVQSLTRFTKSAEGQDVQLPVQERDLRFDDSYDGIIGGNTKLCFLRSELIIRMTKP